MNVKFSRYCYSYTEVGVVGKGAVANCLQGSKALTVFGRSREQDLLDSYDCGIRLRSSSKVKFDVEISNSEIYGKSFYIRGVKY